MPLFSRPQLETLWRGAGGDPGLSRTMAAIALAESGGDPRALHRDADGSIDRGLWQINSVHGYGRTSFDPQANAREAVSIESSQGLSAWSTYQSGAYRRFLGRGGGSGGGVSNQRTGSAFAQDAARYVGRPYVWGGSSPKGFDCSGLVEYSLTSDLGLRNVPRTSEAQYAWTRRVSADQVQAGDLVFLNFPGEQSPGHVMIYAGGKKVIQAPRPGKNVEIASFDPKKPGQNEWGAQIIGYGRVPGLSYAGEPAGPDTPSVLGAGGSRVGGTRDRPAGDSGGGGGSVFDSIVGAVGWAANPFGSLIGGVSGAADFLKAALWLVNPLNWLRAFEVLIGAVLVVLSILIFVKADQVIEDVGAVGAGVASKIPAA